MKIIKYACLLRGINVGKKRVPMIDLRHILESLGFQNVQTLLNSGNVVFKDQDDDINNLYNKIEQALEETFGFKIDVILKKHEEIQALVKTNPFEDVRVTPQTRLYVTFLKDKVSQTLTIPYHSPENNFTILKVYDFYIISVLVVTNTSNTTDGMKILEDTYGKHITTRNWNTVLKIASL